MVQSQPFCRGTLHGRLKKRPEPSENDRVLEEGLSSSNPDIFSHRDLAGGRGWAPRRDWSRPGRAPIDSILHMNMEIVGNGHLLVMGGGGGVTLYGRTRVPANRSAVTRVSRLR
jgi:hypothetical protein